MYIYIRVNTICIYVTHVYAIIFSSIFIQMGVLPGCMFIICMQSTWKPERESDALRVEFQMV